MQRRSNSGSHSVSRVALCKSPTAGFTRHLSSSFPEDTQREDEIQATARTQHGDGQSYVSVEGILARQGTSRPVRALARRSDLIAEGVLYWIDCWPYTAARATSSTARICSLVELWVRDDAYQARSFHVCSIH
ncbi:unnamed protein product [Strongylus vulgaris]|uniref:Uncharacterized protein n=1 Tax=Strongylus vulgaris TaxID=40348 RepID=A0A3P7J5P7_STRVU|nr:unnamed protein product [Strongylus vulgaris]